MYIPAGFEVEDSETLRAFISQNGFATLITPQAERLQVTHLPLLFEVSDGNGVIYGHVAKANDHWRAFDDKAESVAIFHGPHAYISPQWYVVSPAVPTWNYAVVHIRGPVEAIHDLKWLSGHVDELVDVHESKTHGSMGEQTAPEFKAKLLSGIVGFRMEVKTIEGKYKLSQNRSVADQHEAARNLEATGYQAAIDVAAMMRENSPSE